MDALFRMDQRLFSGKAEIMTEYGSLCITLGKEVSVVKADGNVRHGKALDIAEDGSLVVDFGSEGIEAVSSGEVSVRGMYGYL